MRSEPSGWTRVKISAPQGAAGASATSAPVAHAIRRPYEPPGVFATPTIYLPDLLALLSGSCHSKSRHLYPLSALWAALDQSDCERDRQPRVKSESIHQLEFGLCENA